MKIIDMIPKSFLPFDTSDCGYYLYSLESDDKGTSLAKHRCQYDGTFKRIEGSLLQTLPGEAGQISGLAFHPNIGLFIAICEYSQNMVVIDAELNVAYLPYSHDDISLDGGDIYIDVTGVYSYLRVTTGKDLRLSAEKTNIDFYNEFPMETVKLNVGLSDEITKMGFTLRNLRGTGVAVTISGRVFISGWVLPESGEPIYNIIMEATIVDDGINIHKLIPLSGKDQYVVSGISEVNGCVGSQLVLSWTSVVTNTTLLSNLTEAELDVTKNFTERLSVTSYEGEPGSGLSLDSAACKYVDREFESMSVGDAEFLKEGIKEDGGFMVNFGLPFMNMLTDILVGFANS